MAGDHADGAPVQRRIGRLLARGEKTIRIEVEPARSHVGSAKCPDEGLSIGRWPKTPANGDVVPIDARLRSGLRNPGARRDAERECSPWANPRGGSKPACKVSIARSEEETIPWEALPSARDKTETVERLGNQPATKAVPLVIAAIRSFDDGRVP